jgi:transcriptional regulator with XRE-family HTH domain
MPTRRAATEFDKAVGRRLRDVRVDSGLKIWEAAARAGMGEQNWQLHERGSAKITMDKIALFAQALGVDPHDLFVCLFPTGVEVFPKIEPADVTVERHHRGFAMAAAG